MRPPAREQRNDEGQEEIGNIPLALIMGGSALAALGLQYGILKAEVGGAIVIAAGFALNHAEHME